MEVQPKEIVVALAGNPNAGKTTIFNALTGARQHVGNYPGVTVERKEGFLEHKGVRIRVVDLPGTYSLSPYSPEEVVARDFLVDEKPDVVVDIVDASNLERNLFLAVQIMELGSPLVLAFNMIDLARANGYEINTGLISERLGVPIVETIGHRKEGLDALLDAVVARAREEKRPESSQHAMEYGREADEEIALIADLVARKEPVLAGRYGPRWIAIKLVENDPALKKAITSREVLFAIEKAADRLERILGDPPEAVITAARYGHISGACEGAVRKGISGRKNVSDAIDSVVLNRALGLPLFLGLMYFVFYLTFTLGEPPMGWIESFFGLAGETISGLWPEGSESILKSLIVDGVIGGVGGVLVFLPNILLLFLAIAILEDTGYMARAAFVMDRIMHSIGLHGKSFIPLLLGFGCSVPAIMATRTIENERDRLTTMLVAPLMSCGARLPIYALIIPAFFPAHLNAPILWSIYIVGILLAIAAAKLLRSTLFRGESVPFMMELPPYRFPTLRGLFMHMWERAWLYVKKAGTIILGISILLWAASTFPQREFSEAEMASLTEEEIQAETLAYTISGRIGKAMEPVITPLGFDWRIGTALVGALAAKEVFVAQLGVVYSVGDADEESEPLRETLAKSYTPLQAFAIMLFCLVSAPCIATFAVTRRESNSWKWAFFQFGGLTVLAYIVTLAAYQIGYALGIGTA